MLKADVILVSDTSMLGADLPSLTTGLRGLAYWEIEVTGPNRDLHSGHFGGAVANPINTLWSEREDPRLAYWYPKQELHRLSAIPYVP